MMVKERWGQYSPHPSLQSIFRHPSNFGTLINILNPNHFLNNSSFILFNPNGLYLYILHGTM